jgi:diaminopimelate epimerase
MHGCGNDYCFVDCFNSPPPLNPEILALQISDRRRSAGGDGLVLMLAPDHPCHQGRMRMFNADGSEGTLCGNALRCMALWLHKFRSSPPLMTLEMGTSTIDAEVLSMDPGDRLAGRVRITLTPPRMLRPDRDWPSCLSKEIAIPDANIPGLLMAPQIADPGNPHLILFIRSLTNFPFESLGPLLEKHPAFPNRTNVEFTEILSPNEARVRVWERGSGETLACGSGACAVAMAGAAAGLFNPHQPVQIHMSGGPLLVRLQPSGHTYLEGPAEECCRGSVFL